MTERETEPGETDYSLDPFIPRVGIYEHPNLVRVELDESGVASVRIEQDGINTTFDLRKGTIDVDASSAPWK